MSRTRRILHPSDFSRASGAAFTKAVDLAKANKAALLVVHVLAPVLPMVGERYVSPQVYEDLVASARVRKEEPRRARGEGDDGAREVAASA